MESACRKWVARRFRMSLRDKGIGGRRRDKQEEQKKENHPLVSREN